jgi:hypothetical protein
MTQRIASIMFDLPQPFGPTIPVMFVGIWKTVGSTKDLNPESFMVERRILFQFNFNLPIEKRIQYAIGCQSS